MTINTNNTLLLLTIFSGIMLPLTLIAGIFGMNVALPLESDPYAFWYICGMMLVLTAVAVWFMYEKRID